MFRQQVPRLGNPVNDALGKFRPAKISPHRLRQFAPKRVPALCVDSLIANHRESVRPRSDKNKHPIPFRRFIHSQPEKFLLRGGHRIFHMFSADADPDFARCFVLGLMNSRYNLIVLQMLGKYFWMHNFSRLSWMASLPMPTRATAAKASATARKTAAAAAKTTAPGKSTT